MQLFWFNWITMCTIFVFYDTGFHCFLVPMWYFLLSSCVDNAIAGLRTWRHLCHRSPSHHQSTSTLCLAYISGWASSMWWVLSRVIKQSSMFTVVVCVLQKLQTTILTYRQDNEVNGTWLQMSYLLPYCTYDWLVHAQMTRAWHFGIF